jgi:cytidylate kinase
MAVITISRQFGSGGDEVADCICRELGYRKLSKTHFLQAAAEAGLSEQEIIDFSEDDYKAKGFFDRLLGRQFTIGQARIWREDATGVQTTEVTELNEEHALSIVKSAIHAAYRAGSVVVMGRGGQMVLKDSPAAVHVRVEAPLEDRIQRVKIEQKLERRPAQELIEARDGNSADYLRHFYSVDWANPLLYHVVLNTGLLEIDQAAQLVVQLVNSLS